VRWESRTSSAIRCQPASSSSAKCALYLASKTKLVVAAQDEVGRQVAERQQARVGPLKREDALALVTKVELTAGVTRETRDMRGDVELPEAVELPSPGQAVSSRPPPRPRSSTSQPRARKPRAIATSMRKSLLPRLDSSSRRAGNSGGSGIEASKRTARGRGAWPA